jgi:hypothetical protein
MISDTLEVGSGVVRDAWTFNESMTLTGHSSEDDALQDIPGGGGCDR